MLSGPSIAQRKLESVDVELAEGLHRTPAGRFEDGEDPMDFVNGSAFIANVIACDKSSNLTRLVMPALGTHKWMERLLTIQTSYSLFQTRG